MIIKDNLRNLLTCLGFQQSDTVQDQMAMHFNNTNCTVAVDFTNEKIIYPEGIEADRDTTKNFSSNENFVVLECVVGLLAQGYKPENIVLEPKTPGGREDSHFYCDILIRDNDKRPYMLIECKTMDGKEDYSQFILSWVIHHVNSISRSEIASIFGASDSNGERYMDFINRAELFESVCKIGSRVEGIRDLPFFELVKQDERFKPKELSLFD